LTFEWNPFLLAEVIAVNSPNRGLELRPGLRPRPQLSHVVFDFDGTLSWLRHGWPQMMCSLFREYVRPLPEESTTALQELLIDDILSLNGKSSIFQMQMCAQRAAERGEERPDPKKLLVEYQSRLDSAIQERITLILSGKAQRDDFVVHGARALLEKLRERGLTLIILSGTAEPRVKLEAELLDLARYFGRHIYGGTTDLAQSSKHAVIDRLLREEKIEGKQLLAFGDGPVEIQLAKAAGGVAVGVASDEDRNGSGEMDRHKRAQLSKAGADILVADYRQPDDLLECLLAK
jgi:phosphoglycolate phosphatase-like HAD superfamily hydrolase